MIASKKLFLLLSLTFVFFYLFQIFQYSYNFPFYDDYDTILDFLNRYIETDTFQEKVDILFEQHNEHRVVMNRLIVLGQYYILGCVNFKGLVFIGNLFLLGSYFIIVSELISDFSLILIVTPVFFSFVSWDNSLWAMASLQNFGLIFYCIGFISSYLRGKVILTAIFGVLAIFSSGGGVLILPLYLALHFSFRKYNLKSFIIHTTVILLALLAYFWQFDSSSDLQSKLQGEENLEILANFSLFFFTFLGSILTIGSSSFTPICIGILIFLSYLWLFKDSAYKNTPFIFGIMTFVIMMAGLVTLGRFSNGLEGANISRYRIYSTIGTVGLVSTIVNIFPIIRKPKLIWAVILISTSFFFLSFIKLRFRLEQSKELRLADENLNSINQRIKNHPKPGFASQVLRKSINSGVYIPKGEPFNFLCFDTPEIVLENVISYGIDFIKYDGIYNISGYAFLKDLPDHKATIYLGNEKTICKTLFTRRYDLVKEKGLSYQNTGFVIAIPKKEFDDLNYIYIKIGDKYFRDKISLKLNNEKHS